MARIAVLRDAAYRNSQEKKLLARIEEADFEASFYESIDDVIECLDEPESDYPQALVRWEENGGLYGELNAYRRLTEKLYALGIAPLTVDFAFWDHYGGFTFDLVSRDNQSSILRQWNQLPTSIALDALPNRVGALIRQIRKTYRQQQVSQALCQDYRVVVFNQSALRRCQIGGTNNHAEWNARIHAILGDDVIFKTMPSPALAGLEHPATARVEEHQPETALQQNANLAAHASYCLTNSSGVINEFVVTDTPVVVTGLGRYSGLNVFYEMKHWEDLGEKARNPLWQPPIHRTNRNRFIGWHLEHQCLDDEASHCYFR